LYQRNDISFTFVAKRQFTDSSEEAMIIMKVDPEKEEGIAQQIHDRIKKEVTAIRKEGNTDGTTGIITKLNVLPRPLLRFVARVLFWLEYHGWLPQALVDFDPFHSTCFLTNLGSIKMTATYHHLLNWGTNSFFVIIGEKHWKPVFQKDGSYEMKEVVPLGFTIDERIADGFYFARSIKILRAILAKPEILDLPLSAPVEFDLGDV
ncbi:MAG: 2-oxo acid dehydrogenase subunit E2, partial [Clostridia bacterium]|nr:2-oxo acid dehydrogenase subunit E2 [Clostridia bacterium]